MTKRRGPEGKRAAPSLGGFMLQPVKFDRNRASESFGKVLAEMTVDDFEAALEFKINTTAWKGIVRAYEAFGSGLDDLDATKSTLKKDDPKGWHFAQEAAKRDLERALDLLSRVKKRRQFLNEVTELFELQTRNSSASYSIANYLDVAFDKILHALVVVERAKPLQIEVKSRPELERQFARDVKDALAAGGILVELSHGWQHDEQEEAVSEADLSPFERLLFTIGIYGDATPLALSRWARRALSEAN